MKDSYRLYTRIGFLMAGTAVILGAMGAHLLQNYLGSHEISTFDTGVRYQMYHALAIIIISLAHRRLNENSLSLILGLFMAGIVIFSGSLYMLATRSLWGEDSFIIIGAITPIGGLCFIMGWFLLFFKGFKTEESEITVSDSSQKEVKRHRHRRRSSKENKVETNSAQ